MRHSPPPEQSESFWQASSPLEHDAWHVPPVNPAQHFIPLAQADEALHEAPDAAPPRDVVVPLADDLGHEVEVNW
jgi:hypothetical protein